MAGLVSRGFTCGICPNYGMGGGTFTLDGYTVHPQGGGLSIPETIETYRRHNYDVLVSLFDVWVMGQMADLVRKNRVTWCPYIPLDVTALPHSLGQILGAATYIIPFCKYGADMLRRAGFENVWKNGIYHGVDADVYKPLNRPKEEMRKWLGFQDKTFVIGDFKMNKGDRVKIGENLEAVKIFLENNPDLANEVGIYLHTSSAAPQGTDLRQVTKSLGLEGYVRFVEPYAYFQGFTEEQMARAYNACDCVLNVVSSGGFEIPIIESMSCGVPVIATGVEVMKELLDPVTPELEVKPSAEYWTPIPSKQYQPDVYDIADKLETVLNADPEHYKQKLVPYVRKNFDWDVIIEEWNDFFEFLPSYIADKCLEIPTKTSKYLKKLAKGVVKTK